MKATTLDLLEKTQLPPAQARAILQAMESELAVHDSALATKADLQAGLLATKADFQAGLLATKADLQAGLLATKADLQAGLLATKTEFQAALLATKAELKADFHGLEIKFEGLRTEMQTMRADLVSQIKGTVYWNFAFWVTQLAAMAGILKLLKGP
jgi:hypothetical protein